MAKKGEKKLEFKNKVSIKNRRASYDYEFLEKYTAGIKLRGSEIKSIRLQKVSLADAFCLFIGDELFVRGMHIDPYEMGGYQNHEAKADRKLLLNKRELQKIKLNSQEVGLTIVPTFLFINDRGFAKLEIAIARGKKLYDKRNDMKEKAMKREISKY